MLWINRYRISEPELLHPALLQLYKNLTGLYERLDHLCGGSQSYLATGNVRMNQGTQKAFEEFVEIWDEIPPLLRNYLLFAKSFENAYRLGKVINVRAPGLDPDELNKKLLEKLRVLQKALARLVNGLRDLLKNDTSKWLCALSLMVVDYPPFKILVQAGPGSAWSSFVSIQ